jgi:hypothetical protein
LLRDQSLSPKQRFVRAMINEATLGGDNQSAFPLFVKSIVPTRFR